MADGYEPPRSRMSAATARGTFGVVISLVSLAGVVWWASHQPAPHLPTNPGDLAYVLAALLLYAAITMARAVRWNSICHGANVNSTYRQTLELVIIGYMGNTVLPMRGGEVLRVVLMTRESGAGYPRVIGTIIPERILDLAALTTLFAVLTSVGVAGSPVGNSPAIIGSGVVVLLAVLTFVYLRLRVAGYLASFAEKIKDLTAASRSLLSRRGAALFALSEAIWIAEAGIFFLVARSLNLDVSLVESLYVVIAASLVSSIPAGPGFAGTFDGAVLFALKALGARGGAAIGCVVLYRFVIFVPITITGLFLLVKRHGGLQMLRRARDPAAEASEPTAAEIGAPESVEAAAPPASPTR